MICFVDVYLGAGLEKSYLNVLNIMCVVIILVVLEGVSQFIPVMTADVSQALR